MWEHLHTARNLSMEMAMIRKVSQDKRMFLNGYQAYGRMYTYTSGLAPHTPTKLWSIIMNTKQRISTTPNTAKRW